MPLPFDVVTAWEVLEHIAVDDIRAVCENVKRHLKPSGLFICSISPNEEVIDGVRLHQTVEEKSWWINTFADEGLFNQSDYEAYFRGQYIRGPRQNAPGSFHLFLSPSPELRPVPPHISAKGRLMDLWRGSPAYHLARRLLGISQ